MSYQLPADFEPIKLQDIFNAAWQAFIVENRPPGTEIHPRTVRPACRYLTKNGSKCAVGLVIPDGHPAQNSSGAFHHIVSLHPELWHPSVLDCDSLAHFQNHLHDGLAYMRDNATEPRWDLPLERRKERYLEIAQRYGLAVPEPRTPNPGRIGGGRRVMLCEHGNTAPCVECDIEPLRAENEKLRKDAERYRYIREGGHWIVAATQTGVHLDGKDLDDLIDGEIADAMAM